MSWAERLHKIISEKGGHRVPAKPAKAPLAPLAGINRGAFQKKSVSNPSLRHVYRYRLNDGDGGAYLTDAATVDAARCELAVTYGERLALVVKHG